MICPVCHLHNPPETWRCDCGHDFRADASSTKQAVAHRRRSSVLTLCLRVCFAALDTAVIGMGLVWVLGGEWRVEATYGHRFTAVHIACHVVLLCLVVVCWSRQPRLSRFGLAAFLVGFVLAGVQLPSFVYR